ncbi:short-chain dehydrogenase/reductase SDR [Fibrisoma limi BUZ 3]|uniref:Short-chain dehydrogenase/reductase SDR n=1 Tax=Fibrisoma limi BUZ 3 TaxID=1185876 RepID=I2GGB7_9BACT|nr:SDR family NAD(P)-dependent oxidoreductase [Fibrisoma limi]CCH52942.1 short-chain dehydrogenase/reductase SDR [Fibrisoma limi BUZ 3]
MVLKTSEKNRLREQYGPWAVVTGASSGIGLELAQQLASAGLHLVLNARQIERLAPVAEQLRDTYGIDVRIVATDVSESVGVQQLIDSTSDLSVGLLVQSAGFGTSGLFLQSSLSEEINMLRVNGEAVLALTHHYGQRFVAQHRGGIILLSSMVAFQGVPYAANYAATKAYVQSLAEALALELKPEGVDVLAAAPGPVRSGFEQRANMAMNMALTPEQVGVPILRALGRQTTVLPGWLTKVLVYALRTVPRWGKVRIMQQVMGGMTQHQRQLQPNV